MFLKPKKIILILFVILLFLSSSYVQSIVNITNNNNTEKTDLYLTRVEHYLTIKAEKDTKKFYVRYSCPPDYYYQVPLFLEIFNDTTADIISYRIEDDIFEPNKFVNFTLSNMKKDEEKMIHFTIWVLVKNHDFSDMKRNYHFPRKNDLPEYTHKWLNSTEVVQKNNPILKAKALQMRFFNNNLVKFGSRTASYIKNHRYLMFLLQFAIGMFFSQDALTNFFINGENVGRSHLACALMRANNVPCRVILVNNDQGFWTQMHYMAEYYVPDYGWVLIETTFGKSPYESYHQVINRICYPSDEEDTKTDYIFEYMKGEERWIWFNTTNVKPIYSNCKEDSRSQMFYENNIQVDEFTVDTAMYLSRQILPFYQKSFNLNLTNFEKEICKNARKLQKEALLELKDNNSINDYIFIISDAIDLYREVF